MADRETREGSKRKNKENTVQRKIKKPSSKLAGLIFPVARVGRFVRAGRYARRVASTAVVALTAALEYLCCEILELSAQAALDNNRTRVTPRHLMLAIRGDDELNQMFQNVIICGGGVVPRVHPALLPRKMNKDTSQPSGSQEY